MLNPNRLNKVPDAVAKVAASRLFAKLLNPAEADALVERGEIETEREGVESRTFMMRIKTTALGLIVTGTITVKMAKLPGPDVVGVLTEAEGKTDGN